MGRRDLLEKIVGTYCKAEPWNLPKRDEQLRIFVLRNNDIGDVILTTPLFNALKRRFPNCCLHVGIGDWNRPTLDCNPDVDETIPCNAPWHNKVSCRHSPNSPYGFLRSLKYIFLSTEARRLRRQKYHLAIDVLGSLEGTLLHKRVGIRNRMGAKGYGGGHSGCQNWRQFKLDENAGRSTLRYAEMLGLPAEELPENKPKIFLTKTELEEGKQHWPDGSFKTKKVVISTGAGFSEKCWPTEFFAELAKKLSAREDTTFLFVGSEKDARDGDRFTQEVPRLDNLAGEMTLRQTFGVIANADFVICNSTMFMHAAAAFEISTLVLLGPWYDSTKLHNAQWGHPNCTIMGPETSERHHNLTSVKEAFEHCSGVLGPTQKY